MFFMSVFDPNQNGAMTRKRLRTHELPRDEAGKKREERGIPKSAAQRKGKRTQDFGEEEEEVVRNQKNRTRRASQGEGRCRT